MIKRTLFLLSVWLLSLVGLRSVSADTHKRAQKAFKETKKYYREHGLYNPKKAWRIKYKITCLVTEWGWWGGTYEGTLTMLGSQKLNMGKYRFTTADTERFSNGKETWEFSKKNNSVEKLDGVGSAGNLSEVVQSQFLLLLYKNWMEDYELVYYSPSKKSQQFDVIECESSKNKTLKRIEIDPITKEIMTHHTIYYHSTKESGTFAGYYLLSIQSFEALSTLPDRYFDFDPKMYPGAKVIDW